MRCHLCPTIMVNAAADDWRAMSRIDASLQTGLSTHLYRLAVIALFVALAGLAGVYGVMGWIALEKGGEPPAGAVSIYTKTVGSQRYAIPASALGVAGQRTNGFAERVDLAAPLALGPDDSRDALAVTLMPRGRLRTSARLLDSVYVHQFAAEQKTGVPGLVGKPLADNSGYTGETVWYDPLSPDPFVAKCMAPVGGVESRQTCLRTVALSDRNIAVLTFAPALLQDWRDLDAALEAWLDRLRVK